MIKIEPLFATESTQVRALLRYQDEPVPYESFCAEDRYLITGLTFWQHWLPCHWHISPSVYVAKEDGIVIGMISLHPIGKSKNCWQVDHLVVHPNHRGRGIAQELLRFAFALFGSQGISHFVAEAADQNPAALALLASCGFRRSARITHYQVPADLKLVTPDEKFEGANGINLDSFRLALPEDQGSLYQLQQDVLPADIRLTFQYIPEDFYIFPLKVESLDKLARRLIRRKSWFWVSCDPERKVITSACRVTAHREGDYHLEFAVHPGWTHTAKDLVNFVLAIMRRAGMKGMVIAKAYDYQSSVIEALEAAGLERAGHFSLLTRDHWLRAKSPPRKLSLERTVGLTPLGKPAINLPRGSQALNMIDFQPRSET
jgi:RimJ/RimL family protein N-acetyltransferase